jgi:phosphoribosylglycinamide formyltransferase-1
MDTSVVVGGRNADPTKPLRCAVLISGSGSGMEALIRTQQQHRLPHATVVVISNNEKAPGLQRARALNTPTETISMTDEDGLQRTREQHEAAVMDALERYEVELVVLAGYMRLLSPYFLQRWAQRVLNIHPSLLPFFPGAHAHRDVLSSGTTISGCTVHLVDEGMDTGPILAQASVPVLPNDSETTLSQRVKVEEHRLYPEVITWIAEGKVRLSGATVQVDAREDRLVC